MSDEPTNQQSDKLDLIPKALCADSFAVMAGHQWCTMARLMAGTSPAMTGAQRSTQWAAGMILTEVRQLGPGLTALQSDLTAVQADLAGVPRQLHVPISDALDFRLDRSNAR